ncbi:hypothetical protein ACWKW6_30335 [Dyadobacter jiangsuensis]
MALIEFLDLKNIQYCILGDTSMYPKQIGSDVDIAVTPELLGISNSWIKEFCDNNHLLICNRLDHEITARYYVVAKVSPETNEIHYLAIDLCSDYVREGRTIISSSELLAGRKLKLSATNEKLFYICSDPVSFKYYLIKKIEKEAVSDKQARYLKSLFSNSRVEIEEELNRFFSRKFANTICSAFEDETFNNLDSAVLKQLHRELKIKFRGGPREKVSNFKRIIKRIFEPTGLVICFLGCDGAGKSTIIGQIRHERLENGPFRCKYYYHLTPSKISSKHHAISSDPHNQIVRGRLLSDIKIIYFLFRYVFGYLFTVLPQKVRSGLVIFDRYYYDILVDPARYRHGGTKWLTNIVGRLVPKPNIIFIIDASEIEIVKRKQEVPLPEIIRQRNAYLSLEKKFDCVTTIDNGGSPSKAGYLTELRIVEYLSNRYQKYKR